MCEFLLVCNKNLNQAKYILYSFPSISNTLLRWVSESDNPHLTSLRPVLNTIKTVCEFQLNETRKNDAFMLVKVIL